MTAPTATKARRVFMEILRFRDDQLVLHPGFRVFDITSR
jgi:hypothetical protein